MLVVSGLVREPIVIYETVRRQAFSQSVVAFIVALQFHSQVTVQVRLHNLRRVLSDLLFSSHC